MCPITIGLSASLSLQPPTKAASSETNDCASTRRMLNSASSQGGGKFANCFDHRRRATLLQFLHQGAADDHAVGNLLQMSNMFRPADPEADAERQVGHRSQSGKM